MSSRDGFLLASHCNIQLNTSGFTEAPPDSSPSDELDIEVQLNEREIDQAFKVKQLTTPLLKVSDPAEAAQLRREYDALQHSNLLKQQRLEMLTSSCNELRSRAGSSVSCEGGRTKVLVVKAEEVEAMAEEEEVVRSQLEHIYTRVRKEIAVLKVSYAELDDKYRRVSRHFTNTQSTEFVALNCAAAAASQKAIFHKTAHNARERFQELKASLNTQRSVTQQQAYRAIERMSGAVLSSRDKLKRRRSLSSVIQSTVDSHHLNVASFKQSQDKLAYFIRQFSQIQDALHKYGLELYLQTGLTAKQTSQLIRIYKQAICEEASLKVSFQELSQSAVEKRTECDLIRADLDALRTDDLPWQPEGTPTISTNMLRERLRHAKESTARWEQAGHMEDGIMRIYFKIQESLRTSLACIAAIEAHTSIKRELKLICEQLHRSMTRKPKSSEIRIRVPAKKSMQRSRSSANTSRIATSPIFATEVNEDLTRPLQSRQTSRGTSRASSLYGLVSSNDPSDAQISKDARELDKSNFISYFGDIEKALSTGATFDTFALTFAHCLREASWSFKAALTGLVDGGRSFVAYFQTYNKTLRQSLERSAQARLPDKFNKVKEDLDCIEGDMLLYTFKKKSTNFKSPSQVFQPRRMAKSSEVSFEEEDLPLILSKLQAYKSELKGKLEACSEKHAQKGPRKTSIHRYASVPPSDMKSVIQEVKYYDSAIKALYSTEKQAKVRLPSQEKPLLSKKIRVNSSRLQLEAMCSLAKLPLKRKKLPHN
jgi:hypothetical protein